MATRKTAAQPVELNREEIVAATCRLINREGVDAFTMRALANEMKVSPMAAYRHVSNKDELLLMAVDSVLSKVVLPEADQPWPDRFRQVAHNVWEAIEDHRWILGFVISRNQPVPELERILDELRNILKEAGMPADEAHKAMAMAWTFTGGLLAWAKDPVPYLEFGIEVMVAGFESRTGQQPQSRTRRKR